MSIETIRVSSGCSGTAPAIVEGLLAGHAIRHDALAVGRPLRAAAEIAVRREPLQARCRRDEST